jgi:formylglycine-generating enzyme required for sulfatase activity
MVPMKIRLAAVLGLALVAGLFAMRHGARRGDPARERARTPAGMVYVEAGPFLMGTDDADADPEVRPRRTVELDAFYLDRTEVTNAEYARVMKEYTFAEGDAQRPVTHLTRDEAAAYLARIGKRLPTSAEWEKAARGTDGRRFPWGDQPPDATRVHVGPVTRTGPPGKDKFCARPRTEAVALYPGGASPYGCLDMAGNAWEWVSDDYSTSPPRQLIRGGANGYRESYLRAYAFAVEDAGST